MALVVPTVAEISQLQRLLGTQSSSNTVLRLFSDLNLTPGPNTTLANITEVATSTGYAPATLASSSWSIGETSGVSQAAYAEQTFSFTTTAVVCGYYVTSLANGELLWIERFRHFSMTSQA